MPIGSAGLGAAGIGGAGIGTGGLVKTYGSAYVGPLDLVPGAVIAYDQRAPSADYLGQLYAKIRRDSDDATQSFNFDADTGEAPIAAIEAFYGAGNPFVEEWGEGSGNSNKATQSEPTQQPGWLGAGSNGKPTLVFTNGNNQFLTTSLNVVLPQVNYTIFLVINPAESANSNVLGNQDGPRIELQTRRHGGPAGEVSWQGDNADFSSGYDLATAAGAINWGGNYKLLNLTYNAATQTGTLRVNGSSITINNSPYGDGASSAFDALLGIGADNPTGGNFLAANLAALYMWNSVLSGPNQAALETSFADYYGITLP